MLELASHVEQALQQYESDHARELLTSDLWRQVRSETKHLVAELEVKGKHISANRVDREYSQLAEILRTAGTHDNPPKIKDDFALWDVSQEFLCTLRELSHFLGEIDRQFRVSDQSKSETSQPKALSSVAQTAWENYQTALARGNFNSSSPTDRQVYDWLLIQMRLGDTMPYFDTWQRYIRKARNYYGCQKNTPRIGRKHGSSIIHQNQL